jgi:hypothetical protein
VQCSSLLCDSAQPQVLPSTTLNMHQRPKEDGVPRATCVLQQHCASMNTTCWTFMQRVILETASNPRQNTNCSRVGQRDMHANFQAYVPSISCHQSSHSIKAIDPASHRNGTCALTVREEAVSTTYNYASKVAQFCALFMQQQQPFVTMLSTCAC